MKIELSKNLDGFVKIKIDWQDSIIFSKWNWPFLIEKLYKGDTRSIINMTIIYLNNIKLFQKIGIIYRFIKWVFSKKTWF